MIKPSIVAAEFQTALHHSLPNPNQPLVLLGATQPMLTQVLFAFLVDRFGVPHKFECQWWLCAHRNRHGNVAAGVPSEHNTSE